MASNVAIGWLLVAGSLILAVGASPAHNQRQQLSPPPPPSYTMDQISQEFYGRIRDLLDHSNARLTADTADPAEDPAEQFERVSNQAPSTTHLDSPPKPRLLADWPTVPLQVGQVVAVAVNADGNPVIFHRGERVMDEESFNETNHFQQPDEPIAAPTLLTLDAQSGRTLAAHGAQQFFLPHGLTIDGHGHVWLTDVALHQVLKFKRLEDVDAGRPSLVLGRRFQPGSQPDEMCKPTAVAVATTGEFFVADGYCNARILKFNAAGRLLRMIPQPPEEFMSLSVPHGLALIEPLDLLCIADRENSQVVCPRAGLHSSRGEGQPAATVQEPDLGRVFAVREYGGYVYAVNGPTAAHIPVRGFTIDPRSEQIIDHWGAFSNPHDLAFAPNGSAMYVAEIGPNRLWKFEMC